MKKIFCFLLVFVACSSNVLPSSRQPLKTTTSTTAEDGLENWQIELCEEYTIKLRVLFLDHLDPALRSANRMVKVIENNPFPSYDRKENVKNSMLSLENDFSEINRKLKRLRPDANNKEAFFLIANGIDEYQRAILNTARVYNISASIDTVEKSLEFMQSAEDKIEKGRSLRYPSCEY